MLTLQHQHNTPVPPHPHPVPDIQEQPQTPYPRHIQALAAAHIAFVNNPATTSGGSTTTSSTLNPTTLEALRRRGSQRSSASSMGGTGSVAMMTSAAGPGTVQELGSGGLRKRHSFRRTLRKEDPAAAAAKRLSIGRFTAELGAKAEKKRREMVAMRGAGGGQSVGVVAAGERRSDAGSPSGAVPTTRTGSGAAVSSASAGRSPFAGFGVRKTRSMYGWSGVPKEGDENPREDRLELRAREAKENTPVSLNTPATQTVSSGTTKTGAGQGREVTSGQPAVIGVNPGSAPNPNLPAECGEGDALRVRRVRKRSSLLLLATPFKKRGGGGNSRDPDVPSPPSEGAMPKRESRTVSWASSRRSQTLRDKLRRYFRRASGESMTTAGTGADAAGVLPPQHVEARKLHFGRGETSAALIAAGMDAESGAAGVAPSKSRADTPPPVGPSTRERAASPALSEGTERSKSRVTSWADSTVAGTTAASAERLSVIAEDELLLASAPRVVVPPVVREDSPLTLTATDDKQSSRGSTTSMGGGFLHRLVMRPTSDSNGEKPRAEDEAAGDEKGARGNTIYDSLPSQRRRASFVSITNWRNKATVRHVAASNDVPTAQEDKKEVTAAMAVTESSSAPSENVDKTDPPSLSRAMRHSGITKYAMAPLAAPVPSAAQLEARVARAANRWQAPLEEKRSLFFPHSPASPSRSPVGRRVLPNDKMTGSLDALPVTPKSAGRVVVAANGGMDGNEEGDGDGEGFRRRLEALLEPATLRDRIVMSPSVYSRATDESANVSPTVFGNKVAPTVDYSLMAPGSVVGPVNEVVITSHPRYTASAVDSKQRQKQHPASADWRAWIANEVADLAAESAALGGLRDKTQREDGEDAGVIVRVETSRGEDRETCHRREHAQIEDDVNDAVGLSIVRVRDEAECRQPCALALRDAAFLSGLPVVERKAGGRKQSSIVVEQLDRGSVGEGSPQGHHQPMPFVQHWEAMSVSRQSDMASAGAATPTTTSSLRRNAENRPPRPRSWRPAMFFSDGSAMNDRFPTLDPNRAGGSNTSRLARTVSSGLRAKPSSAAAASSTVSIGEPAGRLASPANIASPSTAHSVGVASNNAGGAAGGILTPRVTALPLRAPRSVATLNTATSLGSYHTARQSQTTPPPLQQQQQQQQPWRGLGHSPSSASTAASLARGIRRAETGAGLRLTPPMQQASAMLPMPPPQPPSFPGAFSRRVGHGPARPGKDVISSGPSGNGDRGGMTVGVGGASTVGQSLPTLANEMTLLQILRGPCRAVIVGGGSSESLEALRESRRASFVDERDEADREDKAERDSPGKRMAERWLSDRERRESGGVVDGEVGRQVEQQAFL